MKIRQRSSSFYFLSELLFVILCFALGSVLCVRLFALASAKHYLALDQNQALRLAQPLAEQLRTHSGTPLNTLWPQCESDACAWRSDENGMPQENGVYQIEIERLVYNEEKAAVLRVVRMKDGRVLLEIGPIRGGGKS